MKKCDYCGKEIDYFDQYCDDECHRRANGFYETREKHEKLFTVIDAICVFGIPIGFFMFSFLRVPGMITTVASFVLLGILTIALPFPTENMISKFKIKKSVKITRIIGGALIAGGIVSFVFMFFF